MMRIKTKYHYKKKGVKCVCPFFFHNVYAHYMPILFYLNKKNKNKKTIFLVVGLNRIWPKLINLHVYKLDDPLIHINMVM